ncbi:hypothetical protein [Chromobacterium sp. IIBBL 290-4]|uniref:hypothetical protein n=1 Tax=Chromobacterium sp. IIBBL 290-4 TaxID=2953890 RepID=UPI0020B7FA5C|nr:hypothetical protein [Chromobacterium sp. IIBBL 290-4]UTH74763.1 hypothetical protein NKT35_01225 [Chromobacterium sp. IIBBL 290-4]
MQGASLPRAAWLAALSRLEGLAPAIALAELRMLRRHHAHPEHGLDLQALREILLCAQSLNLYGVEDADLAGELWLALWENAKRCLDEERLRVSGWFGRRSQHQLALLLALMSAWLLLREYVKSYAPLPQGFWLHCHGLFREMAQRSWQGRRPIGGEGALGAWYRRVLLLGLCSCNRLDGVNQIRLMQWICRYGPLLKLSPQGRTSGGWLIAERVDGPGRFAAESDGEEGISWRADAEKVLRRILSGLQRQADAAAGDWMLLSRLEREWRHPPRRRHIRQSLHNGETAVLLGKFDSCWRLASGELALGESASRLEIGNLSASGMRLAGDFSDQDLQAGSLAMLKRQGSSWQLGVVRWICLPRNGELADCGVEFVGKRPAAVLVAPHSSHPSGGLEKGLLLCAERQFQQRGVLVLPGRRYQALRLFEVRQGEQAWQVRAQRLLLQTSACQLMEVRLAEPHEAEAKEGR